jgi:phosphoribosylanthranilate isomerase
MKIKLCGFIDQKNADLAAEYGADFIGFIFYKNSSRYISPQNAGKIAANLPKKIKKVAVLVDANNQEIAEIIKYLQPDFLQLHGEESAARLDEIKKLFNLPIIKAIAISSAEDLAQIKNYEAADLFLFDTKISGQSGGSGQIFDWKLLKDLPTAKKWFLSGGLNIDNITSALEISGADMIDLSSGIEEEKGVKSPKLIKELMIKFGHLPN